MTGTLDTFTCSKRKTKFGRGLQLAKTSSLEGSGEKQNRQTGRQLRHVLWEDLVLVYEVTLLPPTKKGSRHQFVKYPQTKSAPTGNLSCGLKNPTRLMLNLLLCQSMMEKCQVIMAPCRRLWRPIFVSLWKKRNKNVQKRFSRKHPEAGSFGNLEACFLIFFNCYRFRIA